MQDGKGSVLVTGISGFIAKHCALEMLRHGYRVRGTVRSLDKADQVRTTLARHVDVAGLDFVEADLTADAGWNDAAAGIDHVLHTASPFPIVQPRVPADLVRPAVDGTLRVLRAAKASGARSVVMTSSIVAVAVGHAGRPRPVDENDWTVIESPSTTPYVLSKTLAERTARDFIATERPGFRFATINPGLVLGPLLDQSFGTSAEVVRMFLAGKYPGAPRVQMAVVDVRDVAAMHRLALERGEDGGRYLASAGSLWMREMCAILKRDLKEKARKVPSIALPDFVVRAVGLFDRSARTIIPDLGRPIAVDTTRTRAALGNHFIPADEALVAMGRSLLDHGLV